jgi:hypothetical protein
LRPAVVDSREAESRPIVDANEVDANMEIRKTTDLLEKAPVGLRRVHKFSRKTGDSIINH